MIWDEVTGSLDFTSLRSHYATGALRPQDVIHAIYRRIAARGEDHVWIHLVPREEALAATRTSGVDDGPSQRRFSESRVPSKTISTCRVCRRPRRSRRRGGSRRAPGGRCNGS